MHDGALLRQYVEQGSHEAFDQLVRHYQPLVHSTCARELGEVDLAHDVTQVVFLILARKAPALRKRAVLAGWLVSTARFASRNARRAEIRRRRREEKLAQLASTADEPTGTGWAERTWAEVEPVLHAALETLSAAEREAVSLRFFEGRSFQETGTALGISEDAAKMRVSRAVAKLRRFYARRGFVVPAAALATLLTERAAQAATAAGAGAAQLPLVSTSTLLPTPLSPHVLQLSKGVSHAMNVLRLKQALLAGTVFGTCGAWVSARPLATAAPVTLTAISQARRDEPRPVDPPPSVIRLGPKPGGHLLPYRSPMASIAFSPDGKTLATGAYNGAVLVWDVPSRSLRRALSGHRNRIRQVAISPDGKLLASVSCGHLISAYKPEPVDVRLWDLASGRLLRRWDGAVAYSRCVQFSPDSRSLAIGYEVLVSPPSSPRDLLQVWDVPSGRLRHALWDPALPELKGIQPEISSVAALAFSPDGKTLFSAGTPDGRVHLWDPAGGTWKRSLLCGSPNPFGQGAPSQDTIISIRVPDDRSMWLQGTGWSLVGGIDWQTGQHQPRIPDKLFQVPGSQYFFGAEETPRLRAAAIRGLSPEGHLAAGWVHETDWVGVWDLKAHRKVYDLTGQHDLVSEKVTMEVDGSVQIAGPGDFVFSPDGKTLASWNAGRAIRLWTLGKPLAAE